MWTRRNNIFFLHKRLRLCISIPLPYQIPRVLTTAEMFVNHSLFATLTYFFITFIVYFPFLLPKKLWKLSREFTPFVSNSGNFGWSLMKSNLELWILSLVRGPDAEELSRLASLSSTSWARFRFRCWTLQNTKMAHYTNWREINGTGT